jgi:hypothetical protein
MTKHSKCINHLLILYKQLIKIETHYLKVCRVNQKLKQFKLIKVILFKIYTPGKN